MTLIPVGCFELLLSVGTFAIAHNITHLPLTRRALYASSFSTFVISAILLGKGFAQILNARA